MPPAALPAALAALVAHDDSGSTDECDEARVGTGGWLPNAPGRRQVVTILGGPAFCPTMYTRASPVPTTILGAALASRDTVRGGVRAWLVSLSIALIVYRALFCSGTSKM